MPSVATSMPIFWTSCLEAPPNFSIAPARYITASISKVWMDADSMQACRATSDVHDRHVLDGRILTDLNLASRQGFDFFNGSPNGRL